jgi:hypothetical protein
VNAAFQIVGVAAILIGFAGTWLAPHHRVGWLIGLTSAGLWIPALASGQQWAGLANCFISIGICARNYLTAHHRSAAHPAPERIRP